MTSFLDRLKATFDVRLPDQGGQLASARFQGVNDSFAQLRARMPFDGLGSSAGGAGVSERALVFYALAAARVLQAEQLHVALHEEMQAPTRPRSSHVRDELEDLTSQIDVLTLAASLELAQPGVTAGEWEVEHKLREAINPRSEANRREDTTAHARALYNGGLVLLTQLHQQLQEREQSGPPEHHADARTLLVAAQHEFDTVGPVASQLQIDPRLFDVLGSAMHADLEAQVRRMVRLLENAAAELAVPGVTQTPLWQDLLDEARSPALGVGPRDLGRGANDRPWEHDIWFMTSALFKRTNRDNERAKKIRY